MSRCDRDEDVSVREAWLVWGPARPEWERQGVWLGDGPKQWDQSQMMQVWGTLNIYDWRDLARSTRIMTPVWRTTRKDSRWQKREMMGLLQEPGGGWWWLIPEGLWLLWREVVGVWIYVEATRLYPWVRAFPFGLFLKLYTVVERSSS